MPYRNVSSDGAELAINAVSLHESPIMGTSARGWVPALVFCSESDKQGSWSEPTVSMSSLSHQHHPGGVGLSVNVAGTGVLEE